ncbi:MAG: membrane dipeptidase [Candidatus Schekmanbacteria bacterium]|nr:membrane dipeptidase [Candidatus Schekmanbacteria bacterium]
MILADIHTHALVSSVFFGRDLSYRRRPPSVLHPGGNQVDLARAWDAGVDVLGFATYVPWSYPWRDCWEGTLANFGAFGDLAERNPERLRWVRSAGQLDRCLAAGKIAGILGVEGGHAIGDDASRVWHLAEWGAWYMTLLHFTDNLIGPSCHTDPHGKRRLTAFGRKVVATMDAAGILPDLAHLASGAFWEVLDLTAGPVLSSHGGCRALCDHPRNLSDEQIRAIADRGGLIGLILFKRYLTGKLWRGTIADVVRHAEHIATIGGPDCVCIGSDMDAFISTVDPIRDVTGLPLLVEQLAKRLGDEPARKIAGDNAVRLLRRTLGVRNRTTFTAE